MKKKMTKREQDKYDEMLAANYTLINKEGFIFAPVLGANLETAFIKKNILFILWKVIFMTRIFTESEMLSILRSTKKKLKLDSNEDKGDLNNMVDAMLASQEITEVFFREILAEFKDDIDLENALFEFTSRNEFSPEFLVEYKDSIRLRLVNVIKNPWLRLNNLPANIQLLVKLGQITLY